ncbi:MAG: DUF262 domain-containing protein [Tissierellaceae bacterium]|nr:DUF262 domain-containing protein [Tissierellaceae bacterium]
MAGIIGTVINLRRFLSYEKTPVEIKIGLESNVIFELKKGRKYIIPDFQREIRWKKEQLIELMRDISKAQKFLGNIILTKTPDENYEVIDGQQRLTVLLMLIQYINEKFGDAIEVFKTVDLYNASFEGYGKLAEYNFNCDIMPEEERIFVEESDDFNQRHNYERLWESIMKTGMLDNSENSKLFLRNLERCEVNIIANLEDGTGNSIDYFLDVNLKGVKLDAEDIFKGYLFSNDSSQKIRDAWKKLKKYTFMLNKNNENLYPIMNLIEHHLYCKLYSNLRLSNIKFKKEDFTLDAGVGSIDIDKIPHYTGEHLIKVINDKGFMYSSIMEVNSFVEMIIDIINNQNASIKFKSHFSSSARMDNTEINVIHDFIKKIILDKERTPKVLVMKYVLSVLFDNNSTKNDYRKIYAIYVLTSFFILFDSKKNSDRLHEIVKSDQWYELMILRIKYYFENKEISERRITAQYKCISKDDEYDERFRCISLATIYNFFELREEKVQIKGNFEKLYEFVINNGRNFSLEHFIVNNSKKAKINISGTIYQYSYPTVIRKYADSLFNYIFIPKKLNDQIGNLHIVEKLNEIDLNMNEIGCEYSRMVIRVVKDNFEMYPDIFNFTSEEEAKDKLNQYYLEEFSSIYSTVATRIIEDLIIKFKTVL